MNRCSHLYRSGWRCEEEAIPGRDFCEDHISDVEWKRVKANPIKKMGMRVIALLLLIMFLVPFYYTLKFLYESRPTEIREGW